MTARKRVVEKPEVEIVDTTPVELDPVPEDPADAILQRISDFEESLPARTYWWRKGDPAPEWMGPRPVWAEDHYEIRHEGDGGRFLPAGCFWQSYDIELPAEGFYGETSEDRNRRTLGGYRAFLRQGLYERDPHVHVDMGKPWSRSTDASKFHLKLTLPEARTLIEALKLLVDIAETAAEGSG